MCRRACLILVAMFATPPSGALLAAPGVRPGYAELQRFTLRPCAGQTPLPEALHGAEPGAFPTLSAARRTIRRGLVVVDSARTSCRTLVSGGELVLLLGRAGADASTGGRSPAAVTTGANKLEVLFEDDELAIVVKPQGMPTQDAPAAGSAHALSAYSLLPASLAPSSQDGRLSRPRHVHRLDAPTGGLLVVAKTHRALVELSAAFSSRDVRKTYVALVARDVGGPAAGAGAAGEAACAAAAEGGSSAGEGSDGEEHGADAGAGGRGAAAMLLPSRGECTVPLGGKDALTEFTILRRFSAPSLAPAACAEVPGAAADAQPAAAAHSALALVELRPHTGRTHQLRRHLSALGWPIVGEHKQHYASKQFRAASPGRGLFLWASRVEFAHPSTGERLAFGRAPPAHFESWPREEAAGDADAAAAQPPLIIVLAS